MKSRQRLAAILFLSIVWFSVFVTGCEIDDVAVYRVKLNMFWSEEAFPKDYPTNPSAQWSKVFGQSHNKSYALYRVGEVARPLVRDFAQFGSLDQLIDEGEEEPKVYDQFIAPAVKKGAGETENVVFLDGDHSMISLISRMTPSPDWFIGVDSLDLCVDSSWIEQVTLDLEPLDAGAVNGLTFSKEIPWPSDPIETVERITSRNPDSPSSSFYYRKLRQLPPIAKVEFTKVKEYSTKELNDLARKELISKMKSKDKHEDFPYKDMQIEDADKIYEKEGFAYKSKLDHLKELEEDPVGTPKPNQPENNVIVVTRAPNEVSGEEFDENLKNMDDVVLAVATGHHLGLGKHLPRHFKSRLHHAVNRNQHTDCVVSDWSEWSSCSDLCSGEMIRIRSIVRERKRGGRNCPNLVEKKPCGHHCRGDDFGW